MSLRNVATWTVGILLWVVIPLIFWAAVLVALS